MLWSLLSAEIREAQHSSDQGSLKPEGLGILSGGRRSWGGRLSVLQEGGNPLQFLDGLGAFELHQFAAVTGFHPADPEIGDQKAHHVGVTEVGHERRTMAISAITADVAGGYQAFALQAVGQGLQAHHQVEHHGAVLLSEAGEHRPAQELG